MCLYLYIAIHRFNNYFSWLLPCKLFAKLTVSKQEQQEVRLKYVIHFLINPRIAWPYFNVWLIQNGVFCSRRHVLHICLTTYFLLSKRAWLLYAYQVSLRYPSRIMQTLYLALTFCLCIVNLDFQVLGKLIHVYRILTDIWRACFQNYVHPLRHVTYCIIDYFFATKYD